MTIQWYPGHMAKAKREVTEQLKKVDMVIELADARIPMSSRNPMLDEIIQNKPRMLVLTKSDMADPDATKQWLMYFKAEGIEAISINALQNNGAKPLIELAKKQTAPIFNKMKRKGIRPRAIRAMIIGIPNVGKSTVINRLVGKKTAKTGDRPGVTKAQQWLKVGKELELLDTPGILWPKFEDQTTGLRLAATGAIKDELLDFQEIALYVLHQMQKRYPQELQKRYDIEESMYTDGDSLSLFNQIGTKRGCLLHGGVIDYDKTAEIVLRDLRNEKLGRITLETPND
ncbi:ribosome biogenesis GTPase YlqF [Alteribacillus sp. HJP-4]|uniref:ribosome biogenesis GTPase YlqF n=1 Tax=Alteribacillus sp. HJP-4 TaxID=2775394 RepID=UPI0035CD169A